MIISYNVPAKVHKCGSFFRPPKSTNDFEDVPVPQKCSHGKRQRKLLRFGGSTILDISAPESFTDETCFRQRMLQIRKEFERERALRKIRIVAVRVLSLLIICLLFASFSQWRLDFLKVIG